jgi:molecular chaperone DnaK (HSP70)
MANPFGRRQNGTKLAPPPPPNFHLGLDFGTTNSAISFVIDCRTDRTPMTISKWHQDMRGRVSEGQVPTQIVYDKDRGKILGWEAARKRHKNKLTHIKLFFDRATHNKAARDKLMSEIRRLISQGYIEEDIEVIIDYLEFLFAHAHQQLKGYGLTAASKSMSFR